MSTISRDSSIYLDLFDDGLYRLESTDRATLERDSHIDILRLQVFLAIVCRRPIVVPEQWAVSSATFLKVAWETLEHFSETFRDHVSETDSEPRVVDFPFRVAFFPRETPPSQQYLAAFIERVGGRHRIQLNSALAETDDISAGSIRDRIKRVFLTCLTTDGFDNRAKSKLLNGLRDTLGVDDVPTWIATLSESLYRYPFSVIEYSEKIYRKHLAHHVSMVEKFLRQDETIGDLSKDDRIRSFRELFADARAQNVLLSNITDLWKLASRFDVESRELITATGRYVMHRAIAETTASSYTNAAVPLYFDKCYNDFAEMFFGRLRTREVASYHCDRKGDISLTLRSARSTTARPAWTEVWRDVWRIAYSNEFKQNREKLSRVMPTIQFDRLHENEYWDEMIDLLACLDIFRVIRSRQDPRYMEVRVAREADAQSSVVRVPFAGLASALGWTQLHLPFEGDRDELTDRAYELVQCDRADG